MLEDRSLENNEDFPSTRRIMRFDVASAATDVTNNAVPPVLVRSDPKDLYDPMTLRESQARRTREFAFERTNGQWAINDQFWGNGRPRANVALNDVEIWKFTNKSGGWFHPVHLIDFKILDRNGNKPRPYKVVRKDVAYVGEGESVRVIARFGPHKGKYMMHCHNTVHEDHDMMIALEVGSGGVDPMSVRPKPLPTGPLCPTP